MQLAGKFCWHKFVVSPHSFCCCCSVVVRKTQNKSRFLCMKRMKWLHFIKPNMLMKVFQSLRWARRRRRATLFPQRRSLSESWALISSLWSVKWSYYRHAVLSPSLSASIHQFRAFLSLLNPLLILRKTRNVDKTCIPTTVELRKTPEINSPSP